MNKTIEVLKAARELISVPERWIQFAPFLNAAGVACAPEFATCFCALGAVQTVTILSVKSAGAYSSARDALACSLPTGGFVSAFNDAETTTHADVLALFDRAIANLESGSK